MTKLTKTFKSSVTPNTIPSKRVQMSTVEKEISRPGKGYEKLELGKQRKNVENRQAAHLQAHALPKGHEYDQSAWYLQLERM